MFLQKIEAEKSTIFTRQQLIYSCMDVFIAGSESTSKFQEVIGTKCPLKIHKMTEKIFNMGMGICCQFFASPAPHHDFCLQPWHLENCSSLVQGRKVNLILKGVKGFFFGPSLPNSTMYCRSFDPCDAPGAGVSITLFTHIKPFFYLVRDCYDDPPP